MRRGMHMPGSTPCTMTGLRCEGGTTTRRSHRICDPVHPQTPRGVLQASMVHVRNRRSPVEHERFNEAFMMHTSTSPFYPIIASLDVSSKMMDGTLGTILTTECIDEAIRFRRMMVRIARDLDKEKGSKDWWFGMWQPDAVHDPRTGKTVSFADADHDLLRDEPSCWVLHPDETWHGFTGLEDGYCMLDPIKVTVLTPVWHPMAPLMHGGYRLQSW